MSTDIQPTADDIALAKIESDTKAFTQLAKVARLDEAGIDAFVAKHLSAGSTVDAAKADALELLKGTFKPVTLNTRCDVQHKGSGLDRLLHDMGQGIAIKCGLSRVAKFQSDGAVCLSADGKPEYHAMTNSAQQFAQMPMRDHARYFLQSLGIDVMGMTPRQIVDRAFTERVTLAQGTSDFPHLMGDNLNRSLRQAYMEAPKTWTSWARKTTADDFRVVKRIALSTAPDLTQTNEGGGIPYGVLTDSGESFALVEYQMGLKLTRRAIINDDLNAFFRIPQLQSASAARREEDVAYAALLGSVAMADGYQVFDATNHGNVYVGSFYLPLTIAGLSTAIAAMARQTSLGGAVLDLMPQTLLVSPEDLTEALQLVASMTAPTTISEAVPSTIKNLQVVSTSRLEDNEWILVANQAMIDTAEVMFLSGEEVPQLRSEKDFDTEDVKFAIRHTVAAKVIDHRGFYKNED